MKLKTGAVGTLGTAKVTIDTYLDPGLTKHVDSDSVTLSGVTYEAAIGLPKFSVYKPL